MSDPSAPESPTDINLGAAVLRSLYQASLPSVDIDVDNNNADEHVQNDNDNNQSNSSTQQNNDSATHNTEEKSSQDSSDNERDNNIVSIAPVQDHSDDDDDDTENVNEDTTPIEYTTLEESEIPNEFIFYKDRDYPEVYGSEHNENQQLFTMSYLKYLRGLVYARSKKPT